MEWQSFGDEELELLKEVVASGELWRAPAAHFAGEFEDAFAAHVGRQYVHAVSSGTAANEAALAAVGVGPRDEVICTPCSFIASSIAPVGLGAVPVFADVDPRTMILTAETIEAAVTPRAKAVVVVHLWGQAAEMDPILEVARQHNLAVVEDCAQAYDVYYHGKKAGSFGDAACYSLQQSKHITSGEGGIVTTDDPEAYERAVLYSNCGMPWYRYGRQWPTAEPVGLVPTRGHFAFGHNNRMSELQASVALAQLRKIDRFNARRREIVAALESELRGAPGIGLAHAYPDTQPNYWAYPLWSVGRSAEETRQLCRDKGGAVPGRYAEVNYLEAVYQRMEAERQTSVGVPLPDTVHYRPGLCPEAEAAALRVMPMGTHHNVDPESMRQTARAIRAALEG